MASLLRDVEVLATGADRALANPDVQPALERLAPTYRGERGAARRFRRDRPRAGRRSSATAGVKVVADWLVLQL